MRADTPVSRATSPIVHVGIPTDSQCRLTRCEGQADRRRDQDWHRRDHRLGRGRAGGGSNDQKVGRDSLDAWVKYLRERQLTEARGWDPADKEYGGWGYCAVIPRKPAPGWYSSARICRAGPTFVPRRHSSPGPPARFQGVTFVSTQLP